MALTKIKDIKKKYKNTNIDLIDVVRLFDPTKNKFLSDLLMAEFMKLNTGEFDTHSRIMRNLRFDKSKYVINDLRTNKMLYHIVETVSDIISNDTMEYMSRFDKYWTENKIGDRNIHAYKTMDDIKNAVHIADMRELGNESNLRIYKVFENAIWLIMMPLSVKSSWLYGANTKWCTTQRDNEYAFWNYTSNGFLFYIINKKKNIKYAYHKKIELNANDEPGSVQSEFFNAADQRIDSMDADIPPIIITHLREFVITSVKAGIDTNSKLPNYDMEGYLEFKLSREVVNYTEPAQPVADPMTNNLIQHITRDNQTEELVEARLID